MSKYIPFKTIIECIRKDQNVSTNCGDITFINRSTTITVTINQVYPVGPGETISFDCHPGFINTSAYKVSFPAGVDPGDTFFVVKNMFPEE